jgi:cytochrome c oxidase subunit 3
MNAKNNKIHPHKYSMWVAMASITMMFIGFTSAYVVKRAQANWQVFSLPTAFYLSTVAILISSITMHFALKSHKRREMHRYKWLIGLTFALGILFSVLQWFGFEEMKASGLDVSSTVSASFLYVIIGAHVLHVLGGVVALMVLFLQTFRRNIRSYNSVPVEVVSTYWHFVDGVWIYLLIFFSIAR